MKTTFKMSLIALALVAGASQAAPVVITAGGNQVFGKEGLSSTTNTNLNITLGGTVGTVAPAFRLPTAVPALGSVRIQFNASFTTGASAAAFPATITVTSPVVPGPGTVTNTLRLANTGSNFVVYTADTAIPADGTFTLTNARFPASTLAALSNLTVTVTTEEASGAAIDEIKDESIVEVVNQRTYTIDTKVAGKIDVAQGRTVLLTPGDLTVDLDNNDSALTALSVGYRSVKGSIKGDFSWIKDTDTTTSGIQENVLSVGSCVKDGLTATELKFVCTGTQVPGLSFNIANNTAAAPNAGVASVLPKTTYTISAQSDFSNALGLGANTRNIFSDADAGQWVLNGADVTIPYMVYGTLSGTAYNQVIQLTNNSSVEGAIYVDIFDGEGKQLFKNEKLSVAAKPNSVTNIASPIKALLANYNGKVSIRVLAEVPSATAQIYAAYQDLKSTERAIVVGLK